jgi:phage terminase large subunit
LTNNEQVKFSELANFTDKQRQAKDMLGQFKFLLYGGAMGGGKSYWLRWTLLLQLLKWAKQGHRGVRVGLFCEDYPALKDRHLSKVQFEFPEWLGKLNKSDNEFVLAAEYGGGVICFRNLDDVSKYQSAEFAMIAVDELTKNEANVFTFLRTRLRWTGIDDCKFIAGTNPGDIGHGWVRSLFIDRQYDENEQEKELFGFIQALADDNPYLSKSYIRSLDSLPEQLRKAFRNGDWDVFKGQFFTEWNRSSHIAPAYEYNELDEFYGSADWGFDPDSFSFHLHAIRKIVTREFTFNRGITFAELYGTKKYPDQWAKEITALETNMGIKVRARYIDPSCRNRSPIRKEAEGAGTSVIKEFHDHGVTFIPANNDKKNGYQAMRNWFRLAPDGLPYHQITSNCSQLISQIPAAIYDEHNSFVVKEGGEDHALADIRYFLVSMPSNYKKAEEPQPASLMEARVKARVANIGRDLAKVDAG